MCLIFKHDQAWDPITKRGTPHEMHVVQDINNLLNSGEVPGMFGLEDKERLAASMRERVEVGEQAASKVRDCFGLITTLLCATVPQQSCDSLG